MDPVIIGALIGLVLFFPMMRAFDRLTSFITSLILLIIIGQAVRLSEIWDGVKDGNNSRS